MKEVKNNHMNKIEKIKISKILESVTVNEASDKKIIAVSIGAAVSLKKGEGSALMLDSVSGGAAKYVKVEDKDFELPIIHNELAGLVGNFDSSVHKLFAKYGFEWVNPAKKAAAKEDDVVELERGGGLLESVNEASGGDPVGTWVGDFLVTSTMSISKLVDAAADYYDFGDDQDLENKFRSKIKEMIMESDEVSDFFIDGRGTDPLDIMGEFTVNNSDGELAEFEDYRSRVE